MSILPNVLEIADRNYLEVNAKTLNNKEVMYKCPFCEADSNKNKYYLSLNEDKNVFKCWYCKKSGGVLKLISLLEDKSEQDLIEEIRQSSGSSYKKHPAEKLTRSQLEAIGYPRIDWIANREYDYELYKVYREKVWDDWQAFVREQKQFSYKLLFVGLVSGELKQSLERVKEIERIIDEEFMDDLLKYLFKEKKNDSMYQLEADIMELLQRVHPFEKTYLL